MGRNSKSHWIAQFLFVTPLVYRPVPRKHRPLGYYNTGVSYNITRYSLWEVQFVVYNYFVVATT